MCTYNQIIFSCVITILNTLSFIQFIANESALDFFTSFKFLNFTCLVIYYLYIFIMEIKEKLFRSKHSINTFDEFIRNTFFKLCFSLQGFPAFYYVYEKLNTNMTFNDSFLNELVGMYITFLIYNALIFSFFLNVVSVQVNKNAFRDFILLGIILIVMFVWTFIMLGLIDKRDENAFFKNLALYL